MLTSINDVGLLILKFWDLMGIEYNVLKSY
jgi:hypothetical protein